MLVTNCKSDSNKFFRFSKKYVPGINFPLVTSTDLFVVANNHPNKWEDRNK